MQGTVFRVDPPVPSVFKGIPPLWGCTSHTLGWLESKGLLVGMKDSPAIPGKVTSTVTWG